MSQTQGWRDVRNERTGQMATIEPRLWGSRIRLWLHADPVQGPAIQV